MAVYKLVSSGNIISKFYRDFRPSSDEWVGNAVEWIGEALEIIGFFAGYESYTWCLDVKEHRVKIPCALETISGIEYDNTRLPKKGGINLYKKCNVDLPNHVSESYRLNPNYIFTSFEKGKITVYGERVPVDDKGFPMIPDKIQFKEAITYYVLRQMMLSGFKHQVLTLKDVIALWETHQVRAFNVGMYPSIEDYEKFKDSWCNVIIDVNKAKKFFDVDLEETISIAQPPGSLVLSDFSIQR
mgnify:CR=1 FL=1